MNWFQKLDVYIFANFIKPVLTFFREKFSRAEDVVQERLVTKAPELYNPSLIVQLKRVMELRDARAKANSLYNGRTESRQKARADLYQQMLRRKEDTCNHLKGGPRKATGMIKDYLVGHHTFIDGSEYIRCLKCSKIWRPSDGAEAWGKATAMAAQSTNSKTTSEQPMYTVSTSEGKFYNFHTTEEIKEAFPDWNGVVDGGLWRLESEYSKTSPKVELYSSTKIHDPETGKDVESTSRWTSDKWLTSEKPTVTFQDKI